ncbi:MAG: PP0621 family protein [Gallionella sp.]
MSRLFFFIAIAFVIYLLIKSFRKNSPQQNQTVTEDMVRCLQCGVHVPKGESVQSDGQNFCCAAHRDAYRK